MKAKKKPLAPPRSPLYIAATGSLAQLVERFVYTEDVGSSSLSRPTISSPYFHVYSNLISPCHYFKTAEGQSIHHDETM